MTRQGAVQIKVQNVCPNCNLRLSSGVLILNSGVVPSVPSLHRNTAGWRRQVSSNLESPGHRFAKGGDLTSLQGCWATPGPPYEQRPPAPACRAPGGGTAPGRGRGPCCVRQRHLAPQAPDVVQNLAIERGFPDNLLYTSPKEPEPRSWAAPPDR
eukprot:gene17524-biopygen12883